MLQENQRIGMLLQPVLFRRIVGEGACGLGNYGARGQSAARYKSPAI